MATAVWQPQEGELKEICGLLEQYRLPTVDQSRIWQQHQRCSQLPDFNNYLAFILCRAEGDAANIRQAAGLLLKNNLKSSYSLIHPLHIQYIKAEVLPCLGSPDFGVRSTVGTIVSVVVQQGTFRGWPEVLQSLVQCLDSNDYNHMEGALGALFKISEELPEILDMDVAGISERPITVFLPRLLKFFTSEHAVLRKLALGTVNQFIVLMPTVLFIHMDTYLQSLFSLANDNSPDVRKLVCAALVQLLEVQPNVLEPQMRNVIEFMLQANKDSDKDVALEACEFWSAFCDAQLPIDLLREFLPRLIDILLDNMAYAEDDEALQDDDEDENVPDREQDIKPRFHQSRFHGADGAEDDEEDDDIINSWNLRKCSAAGLDILSTVFGDEILPVLMPLVQVRLALREDARWEEKEAAILALGAVAEGCISGLLPHLAQIVTYLISFMEDSRPLVRSISCWTLSRYSKWIIQVAQSPEGQPQFDAVLTGLLRRILDSNKRVQEAACSAFATLEEEAAEDLTPRLEIILQHLMYAFGIYQRRNLRILYDAIGTLADAVGSELNDPKYLEILMPPLISKWQLLPDTDRDLFPLLECFTSIAQALGNGFTQYAEPVFLRCINLIHTHQVAKTDPQRAGVNYDKEFIVCSLDLLSGLAEGLGTSIETLVLRSDLRDLLLQCCADDAPDVRQSALALLGDLVKQACTVHLQPRLAEFLNLAAKQLGQDAKENVSVANNACWAIGEVAIKVREEISPIVMTVISSLVPIISNTEGLNKSLLENSAITLGRLGWVCPELVAPHMEHFMQSWCRALCTIRDDLEKEDAFRGLCAMVRLNPGVAVNSFAPMCGAIGSWHEIRSKELYVEIAQVLCGYKQMLSQSSLWEQYFGALDGALREKLAKTYAL